MASTGDAPASSGGCANTGGAHGVRVMLRVRPANAAEAAVGGPLALTVEGGARGGAATEATWGGLSEGGKKIPFTFDRAFGVSSTQEEVFDAVGVPVVDNVLQGFNSCVLAYGQTSSGKTHTMMGPSGGAPALLASEARGLVPRIVTHLFERLARRPAVEVTSSVTCAALELYNEELLDLLRRQPANAESSPAGQAEAATGAVVGAAADAQQGAPELRIREDRASGRGIFVENLSTVTVADAAAALGAVQNAARAKHMGGTMANETSSRSHTIVLFTITQIDHVEGNSTTTAQLFLVDLAGSERIAKTQASGTRLKEAQNINLSLALLGNVINKLTDGKSLHIPYRDSKLTRLLQDSLGGNSVTTLLVACSPAASNSSESLATLQFAQRAKAIANKPRANKQLSDDELRRAYAALLSEVEALRDRVAVLEALGGGGASTGGGRTFGDGGTPVSSSNAAAAATAELEGTVQSLLREVAALRGDAHAAGVDAQALRDRVAFYEKRDAAAAAGVDEWREKAKREALACESWMRKFQALVAAPAAKSGAAPSARASSKAPAPAPPVRGRLRAPSTASGRTAAGAPAAPATPPESAEETATPPSTPVSADDAAAAATEAARAASEREVKALVRERMLMGTVEELRNKLDGANRWAIICDRQQRDLEALKAVAADQAEATARKHDETMKRQNAEIAALEAKLDARAVERTALAAALAAAQEGAKTAAAALAAAQQLGPPVAPPPPPVAGEAPRWSDSTAVGDQRLRKEHAHLVMENGELHTENRVNAMRLLDLSKKIEAQGVEINALKEEREKLHREIDASNMGAELKAKLLSGRLLDQQKHAAAFRRRLLECFSRDGD